MARADHIIDALGGSAILARETGFPLTTIESWKSANFIPVWRREKILSVAKRKRVELAAKDFPSAEHRISRAPKASAEQAAA